MAIPVQKTLTVTVDDAVYTVEKMSQPIRDMITLMDEWRQREMDVSVELTLVRGAIRDVQNQMLVAIRKDREEAMAKAQAMGIIPSPEPTQPEPANDNS
jgi:coenzyme F420-reducing hydrogenase gamma subunit